MLSQLLLLVLLLSVSGCSAFRIARGDVRLISGSRAYRGRLEVYNGYRWGAVCDGGWRKANEDVVCRQLGYSPREAHGWRIERYWAGYTSIRIGNVVCKGNELALTSCNYTFRHGCARSRYVGIACNVVLPGNGRVRGDVRLVNQGAPYQGRLEIYHVYRWITACDGAWGKANEDVVCRQLGYVSRPSSGWKTHRVNFVRQRYGSILLDDVSCTGRESRLQSCRHTLRQYTNCNSIRDVAVKCIAAKCHSLQASSFPAVSINSDSTVATYSCPSAYALQGSPTRLCQDTCARLSNCTTSNLTTYWSGQPPRCAPRCHPLQATNPLTVAINSNSTVATYSCPWDYTMQGSSTRFCKDSCAGVINCTRSDMTTYWSGQAPRCALKSCRAICPPQFGYVIFPPGKEGVVDVNAVLQFGCRSGYELTRNQTLTCRKPGVWSGAMPTCRPATCGALCPPQFGYIRFPPGDEGVYKVNTTLQFRCQSGYELTGNQNLTCLIHLGWSGRTPTCTPILCTPLPTPTNGWSFATHNGTQQTSGCSNGFHGNNTVNYRTCVHGKWDGVELQCKSLDCGQTRSGMQLITTYRNTTVGSVASHSCQLGYILRGGSATQTCPAVACSYDVVDGRRRPVCTQELAQWSGSTPHCQQVCAGVTCSADKKCRPHVNLSNLSTTHICVCKNESECPQASEPVCASNAMTYRHPCLATVDACHQNTTISIVATGPCLPASRCSGEDPPWRRSTTGFFFSSATTYCHESWRTADTFDTFDTFDECAARCLEVDPCELNPDPGNCTNNESRFYFHRDTGQCMPLTYGGCFGNENNFKTRQACTACNNRCPVLNSPANAWMGGRRRFVGSTVDFDCRQTHTLVGSARRRCTPSQHWTGEPAACQKNECNLTMCDMAGKAGGRGCAIEALASIPNSCANYHFLFTAFVNTSESECSANGKFSIQLRDVDEHFRQNCSFLPDTLTDVIVETDIADSNGCPCPLPRTSDRYIVAGFCNHDARALELTYGIRRKRAPSVFGPGNHTPGTNFCEELLLQSDGSGMFLVGGG